jgi:hypothetical protein
MGVRQCAEEEKPMQAYDDRLIRVQADWNGWLHAEVRVRDLQDVRWLQPIRAPHAIVHADISCSNIVTGMVPHDCERTRRPHRLLVCILKKHVIPAIYAELARRADMPRTLPADVPGALQRPAPSDGSGARTGA